MKIKNRKKQNKSRCEKCATKKIKFKLVMKKVILILFSNLLSFTFIWTVLIVAHGGFSGDNRSDNDLLNKQIQNAIGEGKIISKVKDDIHGLGYDSIIITAGNEEFVSPNIQNKVIVMDSVQNEVLRTMNDFLHLSSPYKVTLSYEINNKINGGKSPIEVHPYIDSVIDIIGETDFNKEIIIKYGIFNHKNKYFENIDYIAIFSYSYEKTKYELVGTYPVCEKMNVKNSDENKETIEAKRVSTDFNRVSGDEQNSELFYDDEKQFFLTKMYTSEFRDFWVDSRAWGKCLVLAKLDKQNWKMLLNCYYPYYDRDTKELVWYAIFSEEMPIPSGVFVDDTLNILHEQLDETMELVN